MHTMLPRLTVAFALFFSVSTQAQAAEVSVYGQLHAAYTVFDSSRGANGGTLDDARNGSWMGVAAAQPISGGTVGLGRFELGFNPTDFNFEDDPVVGREAWIGLRGSFGQISAGRFAGAYRTTGGMAWDPMADTSLEQRRNGGMSGGEYGHSGYISRLLEYRTPSLGGLQLTVQGGVDARGGEGASGGDLLVGARFSDENWELIAAFARNNNSPNGENRNWKLGGRYAVGAGSVAYQYEKVRIRDGIEAGAIRRIDGDLQLAFTEVITDATHQFVGISQNLVGGTFWLAWGYMDADDNDFDLVSYTLAISRGAADGFRWYAGLQYQDRERGYDSGHLLVSATGMQFRF